MKSKENPLTLLLDVVQSASTIMQKEVQLVRAEMKYKLNRATTALVFLLISAVLFMISLNLVAGAIVAALQQAGMSTLWSVVIVAAGFALIGLACAVKAMRDLKPSQLAPSRSAEQMRKTAETLRGSHYDT